MTSMSIVAIPADRIADHLDALRTAQRAWEAVPVRERLRPVKALRHLLATECDAVEVPRVTQILFDSQDPNVVWASVEIDGVWRSVDGGRTFEKHVQGLTTEDIHGLEVVYQDGQRWLFATTNRGLHASLDGGVTWVPPRK